MTAADISAQAADREKAHLFARVPKHRWAYLVAAVIVAAAVFMVAVVAVKAPAMLLAVLIGSEFWIFIQRNDWTGAAISILLATAFSVLATR